MWRHQILDIKDETRVMQSWSMQSGTQRFESNVQVMIYSSGESRPQILRMIYDCRATYKKFICE